MWGKKPDNIYRQEFFLNAAHVDQTRYSRDTGISSEQAHRIVEYSAYDWLTDYYGPNYVTAANTGSDGYTPAVCLGKAIKGGALRSPTFSYC